MFAIVVDHLFINASVGAPEADRLIALGFREGSSNVHHGQGTRNRRFFFHNFMLELLWVDDSFAESNDQGVRRTRLLDRWKDRDACPFGICLLPLTLDAGATPPFAAWQYRPPYAPGTAIQVASDATLEEPMWFYLDSITPAEMKSVRSKERMEHPLGMRELTGLRVLMPTMPISQAAEVARRSGLVEFATGPEYLAELTFDGGESGGLADLRPELPLVIRW